MSDKDRQMTNRTDTIELRIDGKDKEYNIRELVLNDVYEYELRDTDKQIVRYYITKDRQLIRV